jgi:hypothetical protein
MEPFKICDNVFSLNTAGSSLQLFSCVSVEALTSWVSALRLSAWEKSRLEETYTAHLIRTTLSDGESGCVTDYGFGEILSGPLPQGKTLRRHL